MRPTRRCSGPRSSGPGWSRRRRCTSGRPGERRCDRAGLWAAYRLGQPIRKRLPADLPRADVEVPTSARSRPGWTTEGRRFDEIILHRSPGPRAAALAQPAQRPSPRDLSPDAARALGEVYAQGVSRSTAALASTGTGAQAQRGARVPDVLGHPRAALRHTRSVPRAQPRLQPYRVGPAQHLPGAHRREPVARQHAVRGGPGRGARDCRLRHRGGRGQPCRRAPPAGAREIARAMFYVQQTYGMPIYPRQGELLLRWHRADPPDGRSGAATRRSRRSRAGVTVHRRPGPGRPAAVRGAAAVMAPAPAHSGPSLSLSRENDRGRAVAVTHEDVGGTDAAYEPTGTYSRRVRVGHGRQPPVEHSSQPCCSPRQISKLRSRPRPSRTMPRADTAPSKPCSPSGS